MAWETSSNNATARATAAISAPWHRRIRHGAMRAANRIARYKLELQLAHYRRTADNLRAQIANDFEALAYIYRCQDLASARLKELRA